MWYKCLINNIVNLMVYWFFFYFLNIDLFKILWEKILLLSYCEIEVYDILCFVIG